MVKSNFVLVKVSTKVTLPFEVEIVTICKCNKLYNITILGGTREVAPLIVYKWSWLYRAS